MSISAISHYRGGTIDTVAPVARRLKAAYLKHGIGYRLSQFQTGPNVGDWFVVVTFADQASYDNAATAIQEDAEIQRIFHEIAEFAVRISREVVTDLDL